MDKRKTLLLGLLVLGLVSTASAQSVQVEGLSSESINASWTGNGVNFQTSFLNKTVSYQKVFKPDDLGTAKGVSVKIKLKNQNKTQIDTSYKVQDRRNYPNISGVKFDQGKIDVKKDKKDKKDKMKSSFVSGSLGSSNTDYLLNVSSESHYEHLILNYELINGTGGVEREWQNVYSGNETQKIPVNSDGEKISDTKYRQTITKDNLYENKTTEKLILAVPDRASLEEIDFKGLNYTNISDSISYNRDVLPELKSAEIRSGYIPDVSEYSFQAFNVSYPADSNRSVEVNFSEPFYNPLTDNSENFQFTYYSYIIGSASSVTYSTGGSAQGVDFSPDGSKLAVADNNNGLMVFDTASWSSNTYSTGGSAQGVDFSPDGGKLAVADSSNGLMVFDTASWSSNTYSTGSYAQGVDFSPDGSKLAVADYTNGLMVFDTATWSSNTYSTGDSAQGVDFSPDGSKLAVADSSNGLMVFDTASWSSNTYSTGDSALGVDFSPDGSKLAVADNNNGLTVFDTASWSNNTYSTGDYARGVDFSPDGGKLAVADNNNGLTVFSFNQAPVLENQTFIDNRKTGNTNLIFDIDDKAETDINGYSGLSSAFEFTNSSLKSNIGLPFSSNISVSDSMGAVSSSKSLDVSKSISDVHERSEYSHDTGVQRVEKTGTLNSGGDGFDYNWTFNDIDGSIVQGLTFSGSASAGSSVEEDVVAESDWIKDESTTTTGLSVDQGENQSFDTQYLLNGTNFSAVNERNFTFHDVNISSYCPDTGLKNVSSGSNSISCVATAVSGDFIKNEKAFNNTFGSGTVEYGSGISTNYSAVQPLGLENTEEFSISLNASRFASSESYCSVEDAVVNVSGLQNGNSSIMKECTPGEEQSYSITETETQDYIVHNYEGTVDVFGEAPSEVAQKYWIELDRLPNYGKRDPGETTVSVDGQSQEVSLSDVKLRNGNEYLVMTISENYGQSSLHDGTHEYSLKYKEKKSSEITSGGITVIGSSGEDSEPVAEENNTEYSWSIYAEGSDSQYFQILGYPGRSFDKTIVLENNGDKYPALEIDCVSSSGYCDYVDVGTDRVEFSEGFETATVDISGNIPQDAQFSAETFSIRVTDPSYEEGSDSGVEKVDFEISMASIVGRILDSVGDLPEVRELDVPGAGFSIPYIVFFVPLLTFLGSFGLSETFTQKYTGIRVGTSILLALVVIFVI